MHKLTKRFVETTIIKNKPYFLFDQLIPGFGKGSRQTVKGTTTFSTESTA